MADTSKHIDKLSSASFLENTQKKDYFVEKYKHIILDNESIEVLMDPSSSVVTCVKSGVVKKEGIPLQRQNRQLMERDP